MIGKGLVLFLGLSGVVGGASVGSLLLLSSNGVIQLGAEGGGSLIARNARKVFRSPFKATKIMPSGICHSPSCG